jgi:hypothetical protein
MGTQLSLVQLNVVTVVDVGKALATGTLDGSLYMMDNSFDSTGQGTSELSTSCRPGQVINWIIYPMDSPVSARIGNITFVEREVCAQLKIYGAASFPRSPWPCLTPAYDYWAGLVLPRLPGGVYKYRLEIQMKTAKGVCNMLIDKPSFKVFPLTATDEAT